MPTLPVLRWHILLPFKPKNYKKLANATEAPGSKADFHLIPIKKIGRTAFDCKVGGKYLYHSEISFGIDKLSISPSFPFINYVIGTYHKCYVLTHGGGIGNSATNTLWNPSTAFFTKRVLPEQYFSSVVNETNQVVCWPQGVWGSWEVLAQVTGETVWHKTQEN